MPLKMHKLSFNQSELPSSLQVANHPLLISMMRDSPNSGDRTPELISKFQQMNEEHASREYLQSLLTGMGHEFEELTSPNKPELIPDFLMKGVSQVPLTKSRTVEFQQTEKTIPIFGTRTVVELDKGSNSLVSIEANFTDRPDVSPFPEISAKMALANIISYGKPAKEAIDYAEPPELVYFPEVKKEKWHLAFHFKKVPVIPPDSDTSTSLALHSFCLGESPRHEAPFYDYFVDAHSGGVFYYFSSAPRLDISVPCTGVDDENNSRTFDALNTGAAFRLEDPLRSIKTYDFTLQDLNNPSSAFPASPVTHSAPQFGNINKPAVSAHYNAMLVFDFYNNELKRNGIDDKGMVLESVVNVYYSPNNPQPPPFWGNAVWYNKRMWYGQRNDASGNRISYARYLDVIGHELTHGVTETTSDLVYRDLSGALNESFSDIFGIIIKNWFPSCPNPIAAWDWEMGPGLGAGGKAIRNFANPSLCGQPDHFSQYVPMTADNGGVHIYSGIHNLAAFKVLTSKRPDGTDLFAPKEVAYLYYITLTRLTRMSDFSDCRRTLLSVAATHYSADPLVRVEKQDAIKAAYNAVGIV